MTGRLLPPRVQRQKLAGELPHRRASAALQVVPRLPTELREGRRPRIRPDVAGDLGKLLVRDVESILVLEREVQ